MGFIAKVAALVLCTFSGVFIFTVEDWRRAARADQPAPAAAGAETAAPTVIPETLKLSDSLIVSVQSKASRLSSVAVLTLSIENRSDVWLKDAVILCEFYGQSGTKIGEARRTAYREFPPKKSIKVSEMNFGFVDQESQGVRCHATSAERGSPV